MKKGTLTHGEARQIIQNRYQIEDGCRKAYQIAAGLEHPLLPDGWDDADAWALAKELAVIMGHLKRAAFARGLEHAIKHSGERYGHTGKGGFPGENDLFEETKLPNPYKQPEIPEGLWAEVLHFAVLAAQAAPDWLLRNHGNFAALEELLTELAMTEHGPMTRFDYVLGNLPEPSGAWADFTDPGASWPGNTPCCGALLQAAERLKSEELHSQAEHFHRNEILLFGYLAQADSLYLHQAGAAPENIS